MTNEQFLQFFNELSASSDTATDQTIASLEAELEVLRMHRIMNLQKDAKVMSLWADLNRDQKHYRTATAYQEAARRSAATAMFHRGVLDKAHMMHYFGKA